MQVLRTIRKYSMLERSEHVLVAVSGGADSMALLACLRDIAGSMNLKLTVAHLNHGLRGAEADADEEFVRGQSQALGLPVVCERVDVAAQLALKRRNLEEVAREIRYAFLRRTADRAGAHKIATGHNLNDQAETVLMRFLRGAGPGGLKGIHPKSGSLIRPLLECTRKQIIEFLDSRSIGFRTDATNLDLHLQRNRIRHELIPHLEEHYNPRIVQTLADEAGMGAELQDFLERLAERELDDLSFPSGHGLGLKANSLLNLAPALRPQVVRVALHKLLGTLRGITRIHVQDVIGLCAPQQSGKQIELPHGIIAWRYGDRINLCSKLPEPRTEFSYPLPVPGRCYVKEARQEFIATIAESGLVNRSPCISHKTSALLDPDALPTTLLVRSRHAGDRYGGPGHRKVKKMLIDAGVPLSERDRLPMVAAGEAIIWIPGFRPAKFYSAAPGLSRCVHIELRHREIDD